MRATGLTAGSKANGSWNDQPQKTHCMFKGKSARRSRLVAWKPVLKLAQLQVARCLVKAARPKRTTTPTRDKANRAGVHAPPPVPTTTQRTIYSQIVPAPRPTVPYFKLSGTQPQASSSPIVTRKKTRTPARPRLDLSDDIALDGCGRPKAGRDCDEGTDILIGFSVGIARASCW